MVRQRSQEKRESLSWAETIENDPDARPLTREQERELWPLAKAGDEQAKLRLLKSQWCLVWRIAKSHQWTGSLIDDLIGWGMIGLLAAFDKFKPELGNKFSTVSMQWIRNAIGQEAPKFSLTCSIPRDFFSNSYRENRKGMSDELYEQTIYNFCRTNNFKLGQQNTGKVSDIVSIHGEYEFVDQEIDEHDLAVIVHRSLDALTEPRRSIVRRRMNGESMQAISDDYGVTKQRIQQLEAQGKQRMREWIEKNHPNLEF